MKPTPTPIFKPEPPYLPPRPMYFEPEDERCPSCKEGGVCGCILNTLEATSGVA
jgi:hypothetical protein